MERGEAGTQNAGVEGRVEGEVGRRARRLELAVETELGLRGLSAGWRGPLNSVDTESQGESLRACLRLMLVTI